MAVVYPGTLDAPIFDDQVYRLIAETIPHMVWTAGADGSTEYQNQRVYEYTGLDAAQLEGWKSVVHPEDRERCLAAWARAVQSGERYELEYRLRRADGAYRWHHASAVPLRTPEGRVFRWFGTATDIEAEVRGAQILESMVEERTRALREAQARLRALIETEPECVKLLDAEGRLLEMNAAGLRMIEADAAGEVLGKCVYGLVAPEHVAAFRELTERVCRGGRGSLEFEMVGLKGARRWMETRAVPFLDEASGETRLLAITRDITDRRRAERVLRESESRFHLFLEHLPANAWIRDAQFRYTYVNRLYAKRWGVEPQALIGRDAAEFFPAPVVQHFRDTDLKVQRDGAPIQYVDGLPSGRWLKVKFPVPDLAGGVGVGGIAVDITERSRLEEALRESERRFELLMQHLPVLVWVRDAQRRYTYVNRFYEKVFGVRSEDMIGNDGSTLFSREAEARFLETDRQVQRDGAPIQYVDRHPSGLWLKIKVPFPDRDGGVGVAGIGLDISERARLEQALRQSEQRFRSFMEHAPALAWIKDAAFRYSYVNRAVERYHGHTAQEMLGHDDFEIFPAELARYFRSDDEEVLKGGEAAQKLRQFPDAHGRHANWLVVKFPFTDASGALGLAGIAIDVTPRVEAEERARRYAEDVRNLVNRLVQAQEAERRRVAGELHDLIGQNLTALGIDMQALKQRLQSAGDLIAAPRLDAMAGLLETTIDAIRGVMTDLRPTALEEFGLVSALRWHASEFGKRTGMKVSTGVSGREARLPPDTELALFRIVQEALTNAAKHSGGTSVEISVAYGEHLRLTVEDDGRGFEAPVGARSARRGGFGVPTMRERAEALGGALSVEFPARGTRLVVEIPLQSHAD